MEGKVAAIVGEGGFFWELRGLLLLLVDISLALLRFVIVEIDANIRDWSRRNKRVREEEQMKNSET